MKNSEPYKKQWECMVDNHLYINIPYKMHPANQGKVHFIAFKIHLRINRTRGLRRGLNCSVRVIEPPLLLEDVAAQLGFLLRGQVEEAAAVAVGDAAVPGGPQLHP